MTEENLNESELEDVIGDGKAESPEQIVGEVSEFWLNRRVSTHQRNKAIYDMLGTRPEFRKYCDVDEDVLVFAKDFIKTFEDFTFKTRNEDEDKILIRVMSPKFSYAKEYLFHKDCDETHFAVSDFALFYNETINKPKTT